MGFFRESDDERAAREHAAAAESAAGSAAVTERRLAAKQERDAERQAEWARVAGVGATLPVIDRLEAPSTVTAYANLARYVSAVGVDPGDVYGFHLELLDERDYVYQRAIAVIYRDRPEYVATREAFWAANPDLAPSVRVEGDGRIENTIE